MDFLGIFRNFTLIVTLSVVALSVFSMLTRLVSERTREIGTLRSIGFRSAQVRSLFFLEAGWIALIGNLAGSVVTIALAQALNHAGIYYKIGILSEKVPFLIALPLLNFAISALVLVCLSLGAAALAIRGALAREIPDCLNYRG